MHKHWISWMIAITGSVGSLSADNCFSDCANNFEFTGEYLHFKPSLDDNYFVIKASNPEEQFNNGSRKTANFGYHGGFRLGLAYNVPCSPRKISAWYTQLKCSAGNSIEGTGLSATAGPAVLDGSTFFGNENFFNNYEGSAKVHIKNSYQRGDVLISQSVYDCEGLRFDILAGVEMAKVKNRRDFEYRNEGDDTPLQRYGIYTDISRTSGVGPQVGLELTYDLMKGNCDLSGDLTLKVRASGSLLASSSENIERSYSIPILDSTEDDQFYLNFSNERTWRAVTALHGRVGLNYAINCGCLNGNFEIGYEVSNYLRMIYWTSFPDVDDSDDIEVSSLSSNRYSSFGLQGLYLSMTLDF
ncbi:MAG: hypothetical protein KDK62_04695 [Chlamydiia bacterium]|nr:hypothetical protein [Chlamydiia bacterium]